MIKNGATRIVVPGGSTPKLFFEKLVNSNLDLSNILFILSDERLVNSNHKSSNYKLIQDHLIKKLSDERKPKVIPDMKKYNRLDFKNFIIELNNIINENLPIDVAFLGLGLDGHTASLFPDEDFISCKNHFNFVKNKFGYDRITLSMKLLTKIKNINFLVSGNLKKNALQKLLNKKTESNSSPAKYLIDRSCGDISIYTDIENIE